jgi:hypothetical protein
MTLDEALHAVPPDTEEDIVEMLELEEEDFSDNQGST